ncbi:hypothetical protein A2U01_0035961 [Trifolium medium]|uniref:Uncharacterized protein n=1 Tax=Trifolium medium TaxID=97028 RepID=A0A392PTK4_9FABA|nr:hypothetical protein [Trifolium medium]
MAPNLVAPIGLITTAFSTTLCTRMSRFPTVLLSPRHPTITDAPIQEGIIDSSNHPPCSFSLNLVIPFSTGSTA